MEEKFRKIQLQTILLFSAMTLLISIFLTVLLLSRSNITLRENASNLIAANTRQIQLNIDSYLGDVENTAALLFADEEYYNFDPADESQAEYDRIQTKDDIEEKIVDLGLLDNYSDFGIVYSNEETVGWISQVTKAMFIKGQMYETFAALSDANDSSNNTGSAWAFGVQGNQDRLYYAKRYNDHAVIIVSFYTKELENVFKFPEQLDGMTIRLTNSDNQILYSNESAEIGQTVPEVVLETIDGRTDSSIMNNSYLVTTNTCCNGWNVICTLPSNVVIRDNTDLQVRTILIVCLIVTLILLYGLYEYKRMNLSATDIVDSLSQKALEDGLTGLLNKTAFQSAVEEALLDETQRTSNCFAMMDLDNFKQVNDRIGHMAGDQAIKKFSRILENVYGNGFIIGRLGGDEFGVFGNLDVADRAGLKEEFVPYLQEVRRMFDGSFSVEKELCDVSISCGIVRVHENEDSFEQIYKRADELLYKSKNEGKDRDSFDD